MQKIVFFSNIFPQYRKNIWIKLLRSCAYDLQIFYDTKALYGIESVNPLEIEGNNANLFKIKNILMFKRVVWQSGVIKKCLKSDFNKAMFLGEMNILSTWIASIICLIKKRKIIYWTHGLYGNEGFIKKYFRLKFLQLADHLLVYENRSKKLLINEGFKTKNISVIYNSLDFETQKKYFQKLESINSKERLRLFKNNYPTIFFLGRLTKQKKIDLLVKSILKLKKTKSNYNLLIIGDGPEKKKLVSLADILINEGQCLFTGEIFDENEISKLIYNSDLCVSPGNIGLTAIHSLSYGIPVATHDDFSTQMPEAESIVNYENGILFKKDSIDDMVDKIQFWFKFNHKKLPKSKIRFIVDKKYNPNYQIKVFNRILG